MPDHKFEEMQTLNSSESRRHPPQKGTQSWSNDIEFLFSCISLSVGLGNVWRFPYVAFQNGGGTFVVPYLVALLIIGRPVYYMEVILGQFAGGGCMKAFAFAPILRGVAAGQLLATAASITYYSSVMALTLRFLVASFSAPLPWSYCREVWGVADCLDDRDPNATLTSLTNRSKITAAQLYFQREILHEKENINEGIGWPNADLVVCLAIAWLVIGGILCRGVKSSGKAAYFLGVFPYVVLVILLVRTTTLTGAWHGISYFFKPQWSELWNPLVWYAAVTQVFFSLAICFGTVITYASYNSFSRVVHKDIAIVTAMDSCASLMAGGITFGVLGNLAHQMQIDDIGSVVMGGTGLPFISYPDAIAKFDVLQQPFAVLFFLMLFVLGAGSTVGMGSCLMRALQDHCPKVDQWQLAAMLTLIGFGLSLVYMTPGGQFILHLVDFHGVSFAVLILAICELAAVSWLYGIKRFCQDIEFMLGQKTGHYWRLCWLIITPGLMIVVLIYMLSALQPLTYNGATYPVAARVVGWTLTAVVLVQIPIFAVYTIYKRCFRAKGHWRQRFYGLFEPHSKWGPADERLHEEYVNYRHRIDYKIPTALNKL